VARMANGPDVTPGRVLEIIASGEHR